MLGFLDPQSPQDLIELARAAAPARDRAMQAESGVAQARSRETDTVIKAYEDLPNHMEGLRRVLGPKDIKIAVDRPRFKPSLIMAKL